MLRTLLVRRRLPMAGLVALALCLGTTARAQTLNLEGQTGGVATPFAYVIESKADSIGRPAIAFHLLSGGEAVGNRYQISATIGFLERIEVGYTKAAVSHASVDEVAKIFDRGFMMVHAKALLVPENMGGTNAPAIAAGFIFRFQKSALEGVPGGAIRNGDFFVAATKTFSQITQAPIVISGGVKATNATPLSFAGNSTGWKPCGFVFAGVNLGGRVLVGAEYTQQPGEIDGVPDAKMPGTTSLLVRFVPDQRAKLSLEAAIVSLGDEIGAGLTIKANRRFAFGVGYRF